MKMLKYSQFKLLDKFFYLVKKRTNYTMMEEIMLKKRYCDSGNCKNASKFTYGIEGSIVKEVFFIAITVI